MRIHPDFWSFPGRPWRFTPDRFTGYRYDPGWTGHRYAPLVQPLLAERGLDGEDVLPSPEDRYLAIETPIEVRYLHDDDDAAQRAATLSLLADELDSVVAWRVRDRMIEAAMATEIRWGDWVCDPRPSRQGPLPAPWTTMDTQDAVPRWAVTASTPLLRHLAANGVCPHEALDLACAATHFDACGNAWIEVAGISIAYQAGRLHGRLDCHPDLAIEDLLGLDVLLFGQSLPATAQAALRGRPLSCLLQRRGRPILIDGSDPIILDIEESFDGIQYDDAFRARLVAGTETLADVPEAALSAEGILKGAKSRHVKPWLNVQIGTVPTRD